VDGFRLLPRTSTFYSAQNTKIFIRVQSLLDLEFDYSAKLDRQLLVDSHSRMVLEIEHFFNS
jgi:hypothetical protein